MNLPNQLNIFSKGYFYLYGIAIPFLWHNLYEFVKMQIPTGLWHSLVLAFFSWFGDYRSLRF